MEKKGFLMIIGVMFLLVLAGLFINIKTTGYTLLKNEKETVNINYNNLEEVFSESELVQNFPKNGAVLLRFYNFNSGVREWEKSFVIEKGKVSEGFTENVDMIVIVHSKYLKQLNNNNFCETLKEARKQGDLGVEMRISDPLFLWKYRGLMGYRGCF